MKKLLCLILAHQYGLVISDPVLIACKRCRLLCGMNDNARTLIPWDAEMEERDE